MSWGAPVGSVAPYLARGAADSVGGEPTSATEFVLRKRQLDIWVVATLDAFKVFMLWLRSVCVAYVYSNCKRTSQQANTARTRTPNSTRLRSRGRA